MRRTVIQVTVAVGLAGALAVGGAAIAAAATPAPAADPSGGASGPALGGIETAGRAINGVVSQVPGPLGDVD